MKNQKKNFFSTWFKEFRTYVLLEQKAKNYKQFVLPLKLRYKNNLHVNVFVSPTIQSSNGWIVWLISTQHAFLVKVKMGLGSNWVFRWKGATSQSCPFIVIPYSLLLLHFLSVCNFANFFKYMVFAIHYKRLGLFWSNWVK